MLSTRAQSDTYMPVHSLIETNSFKNLVHLSLSLTAGNDAAIKQYLAGCLRTEKAEAARLRADLEASAANLAMAEAATKTAVVAEAAAKAELGTLGERLSAEHAADALAARGAAVQAQAELQERAAAEARAREDRVNAQVSAAEQRVNELATSNAALTERCHSAEASLAEASAKAAASAAMSASLTADLAAARQESRGLATAKHEAQNEINSNRIRIAELAQQVRGKDEVAQQQSQLLAVGGEQRTLLEAALRESETQRTAAEQARAATALELSAARQQVSELQEEVRAAEKKVSSRGEVLVRQERVLESKIDELEAARGQVVAAEAAATASETEKAHLQQALDKATAEAAERTRMLEKSENIITWLNRQLNDKETVAARSSRHTLAGNRSLSPLSDSGAGSSESVAGSPPEKATDKSSTGRPLQVPPAGSMLEARRAVAPFGNSAANSSNRSGPVRYTAQKPSGGGSIHSAYSEYGLKLASTASSKPDALAKYLPESVSGTSAVASSSAKSKIPTKAGRLMGEGIEPSVAAKSPEPTMKAASPSPHADTDLDRSIETCDKSIDADALIRDALAVINS